MKEKVEDMTVKEFKKILKKSKKEKKKKIKKAKRARRKWRFTEKTIFGVLLFSVVVYISAIIYAFSNKDSSIWAFLLPVIGTLSSTAFAVFVWKEKNENWLKIKANPHYDTEKLEEELREEIEEEFKNLGR